MNANPFTLWAKALPLPRRKTEREGAVTTSYVPGIEQRYDTDMPWIIYTYGRIHDRWWPFWRSSRILGRAAIGVECAVCGRRRVVVAKMPRFGPVNPSGTEHPERVRFKLDHLHREKPHPMAWARPLLNSAAHPGGINLDMLAMRLEADLREALGDA